ncbi:hypothetical protein [Billgrantia lactosivorans]|uniref:hypothetical protein n=1 Tax=Billgrantia lactosivorans TaxID=2185141 RepID=UPI000DABE36E|nr:hypothetical protein [Halomonas lactosivorans]
MSKPILYIDISDIRPGKLEAVKVLMEDLVAFVDAHEPQLLTYEFFIDETESRMTCVALHPDSASMEFHMDVGWEKFRAFRELIDQRSIDVYGDASERVMARLQKKIEMLGKGTVIAHHLQAGFARLGREATPGMT